MAWHVMIVYQTFLEKCMIGLCKLVIFHTIFTAGKNSSAPSYKFIVKYWPNYGLANKNFVWQITGQPDMAAIEFSPSTC